jgi:hypothetical protein
VNKKLYCESFDVPGAYLNAELKPGRYHKMRINKAIARLLMEADPTSKEFLCDDGSILVEIRRSLYGLPEAAQLWYNYMSGALKGGGYTECPHDPCVFIRRKRTGEVSIISIYVDDCLHIYSDEKIKAELYASLRNAKLNDLKVETLQHGQPISFLGLKIMKSKQNSEILVNQEGYLNTLVEQYEDELGNGSFQTPCNEQIFRPNYSEEQIQPINVTKYMSKLMRVRYLVRTRPDIELALSVLTTKCRNLVKGDMDLLNQVIRYLKHTEQKGLWIRKSDLKLFAFFDAAFAVHLNRRSHSGSLFTLGNMGNPIHWKSQVQKLVTTSSSEAELVAIYDDLDMLIWLRRVMEYLGYPQGVTIIFQDNTSTITMIYMGRGSSGSNTKHIDIRYFFIKQFIDDKVFTIEHLPRDNMLADFFASPRIGQQFRKFRDLIMMNV